ncbi:zinc-binding oxidoreductase [Colletotrichum kahawae]|uniref:Zinc-binding oxidoreductase n=1 Tax=Colletotrichum kahawae TaxID=34407 RepID=A0AAD9YUN6_COLKA|nr:zinc-binding oxidoreductase [Colletotrichum kahawae]
MPSNIVAWVTKDRSGCLRTGEAGVLHPKNDDVLIKTMAVAINPVDGAIQKNDLFPRTYPAILGMDLAGVVEEVGSNITYVKPGDRVLGFATSLRTDYNANSAFQAYAVIPPNCVSAIPEELSFQQAAVLPLAIATADLGLFGKAELGLQLPSTEPHHMKQVVLIWGGAASVGSVAI